MDIPLSNEQFSWLNSAFLIAYALMYMGGGKLIDVLGTRRGYFLIMGGWSLACASHSLATGLVMLGGSRILLGLGEGGGFPAATKAVAEWFPVQRTIQGHGHHQRRNGRRRGRGPTGHRLDHRDGRTGGGSSSPPAPSGFSGRSGG